MKLLQIYLLIVNAAGFLLMLIDKWRAKKNLWRIPEKALLGIAFIGGSLGIFLGMRTVRHKTLHPQFSLGVPIMLAVQAVLVLILFA